MIAESPRWERRLLALAEAGIGQGDPAATPLPPLIPGTKTPSTAPFPLDSTLE